ncbi:Sec14 cytosolic factor, partial [Globisporangium splendens]
MREAPAEVVAAHIPPAAPRDRETATSTIGSVAADLHQPTAATPTTDQSPSSELSMTAQLELHWSRRKTQFFAHFKALSDEEKGLADPLEKPVEKETQSPPSSGGHADSKCHVCNAALRLLRLRHHCRNCGLAVCGVHSKNQVPLPHLGIMKEVRVCDICTRQLVQRRAGYRSPKKQRRSSAFGRHESADEDDVLSPLVSDRLPSPITPRTDSSLSYSGSMDSQLFGPMDGIIYSCTLEEQDNTVDDILYLGTFTMGGRSFVSRRMSANVAIWKDRTFMLTSAEMLCFKASEDDAALGEVRSSVHLTEILHVEVSDEFPRILTVIRSDGRIFRIRAKTPEQCQEIAVALKKAMQQFQDAMYKLQRGPQPEDNCISCATVQHESSLPEQVVVAAPAIGEVFHVDMYPSSILRLYVNGPNANGVALYSCEMLQSRDPRSLVVEADPLPSAPNELNRLHVTLQSTDVPPTASMNENRRKFWGFIAFLVALASGMKTMRVTSVELLAWLLALILVLTRFHNPISLLITTKRLHFYKKFSVSCAQIVMGKSDEENVNELIPDDELDNRFLEGCNGEVDEAKRRYVKTMAWRKENDIDNIFLRPAPKYHIMKESMVHYTHKKDKLGHPVSIEYLGSMRKSMEYFLAQGVTYDEAVMHHILGLEFLFKVVDPRPFPEGVMLKIYDIKGISWGDVSGDVFNYMKQLGEIVAEYNPERIYQVFILNPPTWFNLIWKLVSPLINPKTRERVHVLRGQKDIQKALLEFIDPENLPVEFGGKCKCEGGCATHSPEETDLREYVEFVNNYKGEPGDAVVKDAFEKLCAKYHAQLPPGEWNSATTATPPTSAKV